MTHSLRRLRGNGHPELVFCTKCGAHSSNRMVLTREPCFGQCAGLTVLGRLRRMQQLQHPTKNWWFQASERVASHLAWRKQTNATKGNPGEAGTRLGKLLRDRQCDSTSGEEPPAGMGVQEQGELFAEHFAEHGSQPYEGALGGVEGALEEPPFWQDHGPEPGEPEEWTLAELASFHGGFEF